MPSAGSNLDPSSESFLCALAYEVKNAASSSLNFSANGLNPASSKMVLSVESLRSSASALASAMVTKYELSNASHFSVHDDPPFPPIPALPSLRATLVPSVNLVFSAPRPERSLNARPRVCAPERATISSSLSPMRPNTLRRCPLGVGSSVGLVPDVPPYFPFGPASASGRLPSGEHCSGEVASMRPYLTPILGPPASSMPDADAIWKRSA
mmetsp:Transcript_65942/g.157380  ORF Transcript_65942/g.157380 Transcript_65942/m.157380 type:complete len:211 (-) Transcript_65942:459-1091(-)